MESNTVLPGMGSGTLGHEMSPHQQPLPAHHLHHPHQLVPFASSLINDSNSDHHSHQQAPPKHPPYGMQIGTKPTAAIVGKQQLSSFSDDEETASGYAPDDGGAAGDSRGGKRASLWQRMKWTDDMIRLLIMVVFFVGDDGGGLDTSPGGEKKKLGGSTGSASGLLQKKGKWKSVSRAMMEKGYYVSPQQCEDKFNDLNKRYKRVNDILGKGTACKVVENQSLLETMDHISPKMKEEVRKLLNSKHLFFREMCAYHTSCAGGHQPCEASGPIASHHQQPQLQLVQPHDQRCFHSETGNKEAEDENEQDDEDDGSEDDDEEDEDVGYGDDHHAGVDDADKRSSAKRFRRGGSGSVSSLSPMQQQLKSELASVLQDGGKSVLEQRQWIRNRSLMLEEQKVSYQCQAFELEKQRFKWQKFSRKKERELERMKLDNERTRLENERMLLILRQKEIEIDSVIRRSEPSSITG